MKRTEHDKIMCTQGKGLRYNYKSWSASFTCPTCGRIVSQNLNFLGRKKLYCNGLVLTKERA